MKKSTRCEQLPDKSGDFPVMIEQEGKNAADGRANDGAKKAKPTALSLSGFRLQPVPFLLGLLVSLALAILLKI